MTLFFGQYFSLLIYFIISLILAVVFFGLSYVVALHNSDTEKLSAYECGFHPFQDTRSKFDVRFYLVAILFIIFDLEITFLFPWSLVIGSIGNIGYYSMMIFLWILIIGFFYEWKKGALDWE